MKVYIAEHAYKHGLTEDQIRFAWKNFLAMQRRHSPDVDRVVCTGSDQKGLLIQMVAVEKSVGILIYHAMSPPTESVLAELGLKRKKK